MKWLDISSNGMNSLSSNLPISLEVLIAKNNRLFYAPINRHLLSLRSLTTLDLSQNQLEELPDITPLSELRVLNLSKNLFKEIPDAVYTLRANLEVLEMFSNKIQVLKPEIGDLAYLLVLDLTDNSISSVPDTIGNLKLLTELKLGRNLISELPDTLGALEELTVLELHENHQLLGIPIATATLLKLKRFLMHTTKAENFPWCLDSWTQLVEVSLKNNSKIQAIPGTTD